MLRRFVIDTTNGIKNKRVIMTIEIAKLRKTR